MDFYYCKLIYIFNLEVEISETVIPSYSIIPKSNQILFIWHLSYFKCNTKCLTEAKNHNDKTYQPSHPHKYPERHRDIQTHTHTHTHKHTNTQAQTHCTCQTETQQNLTFNRWKIQSHSHLTSQAGMQEYTKFFWGHVSACFE